MAKIEAHAESGSSGGISLGSRIDSLDGLRGLAIIGVVAEHTLPYDRIELSWLQPFSVTLSMGWVGVELFFVISGYLITRILLRAKEKDRYYRNFWGRRAARILPGYVLLLGAVYLLLPPQGEGAWFPVTAPGENVLWYAFFLVNFFSLLGFAPHQFLLLTWSISIEQQFYFAWPLVCRGLDARRLAILSAALFLLATATRILLYETAMVDTSSLYYLGITHFDGIAAGAFVAAIGPDMAAGASWLRRYRAPATLLAAAAAVGTTLFASLLPRDGVEIALHPAMSMVGYGVFALLFAFLLWMAVAPGKERAALAWRGFLEWSPLRFTGRISYSLYLIHVPIVFLVQSRLAALGPVSESWWGTGAVLVPTLLGIGVTLAMASVIFAIVERPFIRIGQRLFA